MRPTPEMIPVLIDAAKALKGSQRRQVMARTAQPMGRGGQRWAEGHLGWCRDTIRKGSHELRSGVTCVDASSARRRKPAEEHLPRLLDGIRDIADGQRQADPEFRTRRPFIRIGAAEVRRRLITRKGDTDEQLPTQQTINTQPDLLGYRLSKVAKCRPQEGFQTDAIFERLSRVNPQADEAPGTPRLSLDARAAVNVGPFSRRGRSRTGTEAADHDFKPEATLAPFGIFSPEHDDLTLYMARSKVASDFIVDRLRDWREFNKVRFPESWLLSST